jgi:DNA-binding NarL/FixJ family response regulator
VRVLLVDDHVIVRKAMAMMLRSEPDIEVVGEAGNGKRAVELVHEMMPDVVLMDINMPDMDGIEATRLIHAEAPGVRVVGVSMYDGHEYAQRMLDAGVAAYVCKTDGPDILLAAIRRSAACNADPLKPPACRVVSQKP